MSQCFCMKSTPGRLRCMVTWCTQWPTSAVGLGIMFETRPLMGFQCSAAIVAAECPGCGDGDEDAVGIGWIDNDGVQAHAACAGLPVGACAVAAQAGQLLPICAAVYGLEQRGVFNARIYRFSVGERGLDVPHPLELPWMRRTVVPLVRAWDAVVGELVPHRSPRSAAIVRPLQQLAEPAAGL